MKWDAHGYDRSSGPQSDAGDELMRMASVRPGDHILDLGCGTGSLTLRLAALASEGRVVGIDPSEEMLDRARGKAREAAHVSFVQISAEDMEFPEEFDLVFSNSALQWVIRQEDALSRMFHALRPGGRIALQLPARDFFPEFRRNVEEAAETLGLSHYYDGRGWPWYQPSREEYRDALMRCGFRDVAVDYRRYRQVFPSPGDVLQWLEPSGLVPFLEPLPAKEREYFKYAFAMGFERERTSQGIGLTLTRLFALAEKPCD